MKEDPFHVAFVKARENITLVIAGQYVIIVEAQAFFHAPFAVDQV